MDKNEFTITQQIAKLQGTIEEGFRGMHYRQDTANGRIGKCEIRLAKLENKNMFQEGKSSGISTFWKIVVTSLTLIIGILTIFAITGCLGLICNK